MDGYSRRRVLVTNDDSDAGPGLGALAEAAISTSRGVRVDDQRALRRWLVSRKADEQVS